MSELLPLVSLVRKSTLCSEAPLLILLHGYGSNENDLFSFAADLPEKLLIIALRAPYTMHQQGYAWYAINFDGDENKWNDVKQAKEAMKRIIDCVDRACEIYNIDTKNINLLGFSQGCILSTALAINHPKKFKNVVGLSGYICREFLDKPQEKKTYEHLNIYCSNGTLDPIIPIEWARETPKYLNSLGIKNYYSEFSVGHEVAAENFSEFREWLQARI